MPPNNILSKVIFKIYIDKITVTVFNPMYKKMNANDDSEKPTMDNAKKQHQSLQFDKSDDKFICPKWERSWKPSIGLLRKYGDRFKMNPWAVKQKKGCFEKCQKYGELMELRNEYKKQFKSMDFPIYKGLYYIPPLTIGFRAEGLSYNSSYRAQFGPLKISTFCEKNTM